MNAPPPAPDRELGWIWTRRLDEPAPVIQPGRPVAFRRAGPEDAEALGKTLNAHPRAAATAAAAAAAAFRARFTPQRRCYVGWLGALAAVYGWVSFDTEYVGELDLQLRLPPGEVYIWDCATAPAHRRRMLYSALLVSITQQLVEEGLTRAWIGADLENTASQRGIARAGFQRVAAVVLTPRQVLQVRGAPGAPEALVNAARAVFFDHRQEVQVT